MKNLDETTKEQLLRENLLLKEKIAYLEKNELNIQKHELRANQKIEQSPLTPNQSTKDFDKPEQSDKLQSESEKMHNDLFEKSKDAILIIHNEKFVDCNPATINMLGYNSKEEFLMTHPSELSPEKQADGKLSFSKANEMMEIAHKNGNHCFEWYHKKSNGKVFPVEVMLTSILNDEKKRILHTIWRDISNRKKAEETIKQSEKNYKDLFNNLSNAIYIIDRKGCFIDVNQGAVDMYGYPKEFFIGKNPEFLSAVGKNDLKKVIGYINDSFNDKAHQFDFWGLRKNGEVFPKIVRTQKGIYKGKEVVIAFGIDITERKKVEVALQKSEHNLRTLFNAMTDIVFEMDSEGRYLNIAPTSPELMYKPTEETIGKTLHDIFPKQKADIFLAFIKSCLKKNQIETIEYELKMGNKTLWFEGRATPKTKNSVLYIARDITKRMLADVELKELNKELSAQNEEYLSLNEELSDSLNQIQEINNKLTIAKEKAEESNRLITAFMRNISHETRTPMNSILGFAKLLEEPALTGNQQQKYLSIIQENGNRMLNTISDIVNISLIEADQQKVNLTETNINHEIENIYSIFESQAYEKGIHLLYVNSLLSGSDKIYTDKDKLSIILSNLLKNAIKYTSAGNIDFGYLKKRNNIEFFVRDTGIGIQKNQQNNIFKPFVKADVDDSAVFEGSGLGLAIAKAYVEMLKGKIWVESDLNKGSDFYFSIPINTENFENTRNKKEYKNKTVSNSKNLKILIAEDEISANIHLSLITEKICKEVFQAKTGRETIDICRQNPDIDIVLMDIRMPDIDGYKATSIIREFNKNIIIIAQTAYALPGDRNKAIEAGCNDYIAKPIDKQKLLNMIEKYMTQK